MATALILIGGHLTTAPRPYKEACALAAAGWDVTVCGVWSDPLFVDRDRAMLRGAPFRFHPIADLRPVGVRGRWGNLRARATVRLASERFRRTRHFSLPLLGYAGYLARAMLARARHERPDLTIAHCEAALWVGHELRRDRLRVGVDFEDWFSEDLLPEDRAARPIEQLRELERELARECTYAVTTSRALARALALAYDAPEPEVLYNAFPRADLDTTDPDHHDRRRRDWHSLHWFSQTIGPGRGLELLFAALPALTRPVEVHLRGHLSERGRAWMDATLPASFRDHVFVHPTVPNAELLSRIAEHDIGLALEIPYCPSRNLTVTNKVFQYLQGGLAVVATDTEGQREVLAQCPAAATLVPASDPDALAGAINRFLDNPGALSMAKAAASRAASALCWDVQVPRVVALAERAVS